MNLFRTAWRNLWRNKRRTLISASSIAFGLLLAVTFTGTGHYMYGNMINASARTGFGHLTITPPDYLIKRGLDRRIAITTDQLKAIRAIPGVSAAHPHIMGQAMFSSARKSVGGLFIAIVPNEPARDNLLLENLVEGGLSGGNPRDVIIGRKMAEKLGLKMGRKLVYTATDASGQMVSDVAHVSGFFETGLEDVDGSMVLLPLSTMQKVLGYKSDEVNLVSIMLSHYNQTDRIARDIGEVLGNDGYEILPWQDTQTDVAGMITIDSSANYISQVFVGLLIAAGIFNTMLMSVLERRREFGVMLAIGMAPYGLVKMVILETLYVVFVGLILGTIITAPWYYWLASHGLDFSGMIDGDYHIGNVLIDPVIRISLDWRNIVSIAGMILILALLVALYPAWRSSRIKPVEVLNTK